MKGKTEVMILSTDSPKNPVTQISWAADRIQKNVQIVQVKTDSVKDTDIQKEWYIIKWLIYITIGWKKKTILHLTQQRVLPPFKKKLIKPWCILK